DVCSSDLLVVHLSTRSLSQTEGDAQGLCTHVMQDRGDERVTDQDLLLRLCPDQASGLSQGPDPLLEVVVLGGERLVRLEDGLLLFGVQAHVAVSSFTSSAVMWIS